MKMVLEIPDDVAASLGKSDSALTQAALEAIAIEGYRGGTLSVRQVRSLLGHASRWQTEDFLSSHGVWPGLTAEETAEDGRKLNELLRR